MLAFLRGTCGNGGTVTPRKGNNFGWLLRFLSGLLCYCCLRQWCMDMSTTNRSNRLYSMKGREGGRARAKYRKTDHFLGGGALNLAGGRHGFHVFTLPRGFSRIKRSSMRNPGSQKRGAFVRTVYTVYRNILRVCFLAVFLFCVAISAHAVDG